MIKLVRAATLFHIFSSRNKNIGAGGCFSLSLEEVGTQGTFGVEESLSTMKLNTFFKDVLMEPGSIFRVREENKISFFRCVDGTRLEF